MPKLALVAPDAQARADALDTQQSWIVEAPAGSGKTGLLIQRLLKLLAQVDDPGQVLAITFTRKATAEMRERLLRQLAEARAGSEPANAFDAATRPLAQAALARDGDRGWQLLDHPHRLNIRTIDAICADIARALPILSGAGGALAVTADAKELHDEAARRTVLQLGGDDAGLTIALETVLLHRDGNLTGCQGLIAEMLVTRDQWGELIPLTVEHLAEPYLDAEVLPRLERALEQAICRGLTRLTQVLPAGMLDRLCALAAEMAKAEGYKGAVSPIAICKGRPGPPGDRAQDLEHWRALIHLLVKPSAPREFRKAVHPHILGFEILKHHKAELAEIIASVADTPGLCDELCRIDALPPAQYDAEQWRVTKALFRVLSRALVELQLVFAEQATCDFAEIALLARAALGRDSALDDLAGAAGLDLQHLLVDEMQDTSSAQYELIQLLTQHWDGRGQTVFLVGDPKQSIYLFRQARVERFVRTMHRAALGDLPLGVLRLTANFRSQRKLVEAFNQDFTLLFPAQPDPLQPELVPYTQASATRSASAGAAREWHLATLLYEPDKDQARTLRVGQSRRHAELIRRVAETQRRLPGRSIAVLVRSRTHLLDIVKAFRDPALGTPIPYRAVEIEPLAERQEILDLLALTRALLHPADRTAWLACLRAPWCGLTLADLLTLLGEDGSGPVIEQLESRGELLTEDGIARLQPFWRVMRSALAERGRMPLARLVERTWRAFAAPSFLSPEARTNAVSFFDLLGTLEQGGSVQIARLKRALDKLYAAPSLDPDSVDLLTIHKAKGLEWDCVFVPALERTSRSGDTRLLSWLELDGATAVDDPSVAHGILAPIQAKGRKAEQLNQWMRSILRDRELAENKRLFYVACTRAREELHLLGTLAQKKDGELKPQSDTLLSAAWAAAQPLFAPVPAAQPESQQPLALAAAARPNIIERIPLSHLPQGSQNPGEQTAWQPETFSRPEGSFAARAFGNAIHGFLELLAARIAAGESAQDLQAQLPSWTDRITAVLRASGLPAQQLPRLTSSVLKGLANTLSDPAGRWLLAPHPQAQSESSLVSDGRTIRLDRTFLAGPEPLLTGDTHLWIVDFKTASHAAKDLDAFLTRELENYRPQLDRYAAAFDKEGRPIQLALYYPMLSRLLHW